MADNDISQRVINYLDQQTISVVGEDYVEVLDDLIADLQDKREVALSELEDQ